MVLSKFGQDNNGGDKEPLFDCARGVDTAVGVLKMVKSGGFATIKIVVVVVVVAL